MIKVDIEMDEQERLWMKKTAKIPIEIRGWLAKNERVLLNEGRRGWRVEGVMVM